MPVKITLDTTLDDIALLPVFIQGIRDIEQTAPNKIHMTCTISSGVDEVEQFEMILRRINPPFPFNIVIKTRESTHGKDDPRGARRSGPTRL